MSGETSSNSAFGAQENFSGTVVELNIRILVATLGERMEVKTVLKAVERTNEDDDRFTEFGVMLPAFKFIHVN